MASPKLFVLACALLVVQAQAHPQVPVGGPIVDFLKKVCQRAVEMIDISSNHMVDVVGIITGEPEKAPKILVERADKMLVVVWALISERLDKIKQRSDPLTGQIITCVEGNREAWKKALLDFYGATTNCLVPKVRNSFLSVKELRPDLQQIKVDIIAAINGIEKCGGSDVSDVECVLDVAKNILNVIKNIRPDITQKIVDSYREIKRIVDEAKPTCITPNRQKYVQERALFIKSVAVCIAR